MILISFYGAQMVMRELGLGYNAILSPDFQTAAEKGIYGYCHAMAVLLLIIFIGECTWRDKLTLAAIALLAVLLCLLLIKGMIILPVIGGYLYRLLTGRAKFTWKTVALVAVLTPLLFSIKYLLSNFLLDSSSVWDPRPI